MIGIVSPPRIIRYDQYYPNNPLPAGTGNHQNNVNHLLTGTPPPEHQNNDKPLPAGTPPRKHQNNDNPAANAPLPPQGISSFRPAGSSHHPSTQPNFLERVGGLISKMSGFGGRGSG